MSYEHQLVMSNGSNVYFEIDNDPELMMSGTLDPEDYDWVDDL